MMHFKVILRSANRNSSAATIAEFPLVLFILLFCAFFPVFNLVLACSAYVSLRSLTEETVQSIAMSDSRQQARERAKSLLTNYENPLLTLFHHVELVSGADEFPGSLKIIVDSHVDKVEEYSISAALPKKKQPNFKENKKKFLYFYKLQVNCMVKPIFNMSGLPLIGLIPLIGQPAEMTMCAQAPVENLNGLNDSASKLRTAL